jgi:hypothetical protein
MVLRLALVGVVEVLNSDAELANVVDALGTASRFAGGLDSWQQQCDEDADDGDDDQELY